MAGNKEHQFAHLFQQYYEKVYRLARRICLDATQAQDLAQEIFMKVYQKLDTFREESALSTWLYSIAVNHCSDHMRREQKRRDHCHGKPNHWHHCTYGTDKLEFH